MLKIKTILFTMLFGLVVSLALFAESSPSKKLLLTAVEKFSSGNHDDAYIEFDQIQINSPEFILAFVEMQKIHYIKNDWDRFFGYAQFYRKNVIKQKLIPDLVLLESMALIKHCQFEPSYVLTQSMKKILESTKSNANRTAALEKIQSVEDLFVIQKSIPGNVTSEEKKSSVHAFSHDLFWSAASLGFDGKSLLLSGIVKGPKAIRVYVKNICEDKKS